MSQRPDTDDYRQLLLNNTPMMDMRSPGEFAQGAFPSAASLPLMSNDERAEVGTCYKREGQAAACTRASVSSPRGATQPMDRAWDLAQGVNARGASCSASCSADRSKGVVRR